MPKVSRSYLFGFCPAVARHFLMLLLGGLLLVSNQGHAQLARKYESAIFKLNAAKTPEARFYALSDAAKESFNKGKLVEAKQYADELLALLPQYKKNWNYGNAVQNGNLVLGRLALKEGHVDEAKKYLLASGKSDGSPQMNSFGPNMSLAKDLLEKNERAVVVEYFELCRKFWKMHRGKLDEWSKEVTAGKVPNFGANLVY